MVNSEYRCPSCREPAKYISEPNGRANGNRTRVGVIHSPTCRLAKWLRSNYPALADRIEKERSAA